MVYTFTQFLGISGGSDAGQITESSPIPPPAPVPLSGHSHSSNRHVTRWPSSAPLSKHSACKQRLASGLDKASQSFGTPTPIPQRRRSTRRPGHLGSHSTPTSRHDLVPIPSCLCFPICIRCQPLALRCPHGSAPAESRTHPGHCWSDQGWPSWLRTDRQTRHR